MEYTKKDGPFSTNVNDNMPEKYAQIDGAMKEGKDRLEKFNKRGGNRKGGKETDKGGNRGDRVNRETGSGSAAQSEDELDELRPGYQKKKRRRRHSHMSASITSESTTTTMLSNLTNAPINVEKK